MKTENGISEHKAIAVSADCVAKVAQVTLKDLEADYTITRPTPLDHSDDWEVVTISNEYRVDFYCIVSE